MQDEPVLFLTIQEEVASITFNRPEALNALNIEVAQLFLSACQTIAETPEVKVVVLQATGRAFMAGGDIALMHSQPERVLENLIKPMHQGLALLASIDPPVIASVKGAVAGAGVSIMLAADMVIAADNVKINTAYSSIAASGDLGITWTLPRTVGLNKAIELMLTPTTLGANQALELRMINSIVELSDLEARTADLARKLASGPTHAYGQIRRLLKEGALRSFEEQMNAEAVAFAQCLETEDMTKAMQAFITKR